MNIRQRRAWRRQTAHKVMVIADKTITAIAVMSILVIIALIARSF